MNKNTNKKKNTHMHNHTPARTDTHTHARTSLVHQFIPPEKVQSARVLRPSETHSHAL